MAKKYVVRLSAADRTLLTDLITAGKAGSRRADAYPDAALDRYPGRSSGRPHQEARPMTMYLRRWCVTDIHCADDLAEALNGQTWCGCTGFRFGGYLWPNDATGPEGAQEFAVVRMRDHTQVESVTFGWLDATRDLAIINEIVTGMGCDASTSHGHIDPALIETPTAHGRCPHCA